MGRKIAIWIVFCLLITSCKKDEYVPVSYELDLMEVPKGFPEIEFPEGNEFTLERWLLGKELFYDPIMSSDGSHSCSSCHKQELAFSDDVSFSLGVDDALGTRNSPSLSNVAYHPYYTREGGLPTLEMQILVPIQEHNEFNNNIVLLADTLSKIQKYVDMADEAYSQTPNAFVITRALATFERSLLSGMSPYDQYTNHGDEDALSESAKRGMSLFFNDKTNCSTCHSGFNFTNYTFENNGLYLEYPDSGRERLTQSPNDRARFKVPSLRNISLTAPYMHDGSIQSLEAVIDHYISGGEDHVNKGDNIKPLILTSEEKADLIAFLESLTDIGFTTNKVFNK